MSPHNPETTTVVNTLTETTRKVNKKYETLFKFAQPILLVEKKTEQGLFCHKRNSLVASKTLRNSERNIHRNKT